MTAHVHDAWLEAKGRFDHLAAFIADSRSDATTRDADHLRELYSSWVLLTYAAHESSIAGLGNAVMKVLANLAARPARLPPELRLLHAERTLIVANEARGTTSARRNPGLDLETLLVKAYSASWSSNSVLMRLDRNAWPDVVREWLRRLTSDEGNFEWMRTPAPSSTETLESVVSGLVRERNDIAHGVRPANLRTDADMIDLVRDVEEFARHVFMMVELALFRHFPRRLPSKVGIVDPLVSLGAHTVAFSRLAIALAVGDHVVLRRGDNVRCARVSSLQSGGAALNAAAPGAEKVAVTLSKEVGRASVFALY